MLHLCGFRNDGSGTLENAYNHRGFSMSKKFTPVTDPQEIEDLMTDTGDISKPYPYKPNGHLWVDSEELKAWRAARDRP
jgi:hypothetical protein